MKTKTKVALVIGGVVTGVGLYLCGKEKGSRNAKEKVGRAYIDGATDMWRLENLRPEYKGDFSNTERLAKSLQAYHKGQTINRGGGDNNNRR